MGLFDTRPKERRSEFYDRDTEISMLVESIKRKEWVALIGSRRIGKTSIVNVSLNETKDVLAFRLNLMRLSMEGIKKVYPLSSLLNLILEESHRLIGSELPVSRFVNFLSKRLGVEIETIVNFDKIKIIPRLKRLNAVDISLIVRELDEIARGVGKTLVLVFDEVQEMFKVGGLNVGALFHDIYDWCKNTTVIIAGSAPGLVINMLDSLEYEAPFFGRYVRRIQLNRFSREQSMEFLIRGFEENNIKISEEVIEHAVRMYDGVPGWLTSFGSEVSMSIKLTGHMPDASFFDTVFEKAIKEAEHDVKNFFRFSQSPQRYAAIILALDRLGGKASWSELKKSASAILGEEIPGSRLTEMCKRLVDVAFLTKEADSYIFPDPPTAKALVNIAKRIR